MFKSFQTNNSFLYYTDLVPGLSDYWNYLIKLLKQFLLNNPNMKINIFLMRHSHEYTNCLQLINDSHRQNKNIWINFNFEHLIVKQGEEWGYPTGNIKDVNGNDYLIRITDYGALSPSDIIIDYSLPNIMNVSSNSMFYEFSRKHIYISPSIYDICTSKENRDISILSTIIVTNTPRRKHILDEMKSRNLPHTNINNCFEDGKLQDFFRRSKIVINMRQTDYHDTFEELRVLPALLSGAIIVSEKPPLHHLIPYNDYIIWTDYDNLINKVEEVLNNYDYYHDKIFREPKNMKLEDMNDINYHTLSSKIMEHSKSSLYKSI